MASIMPKAESLCYRNLLVVIKQTAYEEYTQVKQEKLWIFGLKETFEGVLVHGAAVSTRRESLCSKS